MICALMNRIVVVVAIISTGYRQLISADFTHLGTLESRSRIIRVTLEWLYFWQDSHGKHATFHLTRWQHYYLRGTSMP